MSLCPVSCFFPVSSLRQWPNSPIFFSCLCFCSGAEAGSSEPPGEGGRPAAHRGAHPAAAQHAVCGPAAHRAGRRGTYSFPK